jgi:tRNA pseudouridine32 synthase/23S rRNA pseudouridine746 synthase
VQVLFRDASLLVVNKPEGLLSVPGRHALNRDSVLARVQGRFPGARVVHRLDMDTSGVMVLALDAPTHRALSMQFQNRQVCKRYLARVAGVLASPRGEVSAPMRCDWPRRPLQMIDFEQGKSALTCYEVLAQGADEACLALKPVTGRSHQLRLHCFYLGHPILGDRFYAREGSDRRATRLMLHAETLGLRHPKSGEVMNFLADCPFWTEGKQAGGGGNVVATP